MDKWHIKYKKVQETLGIEDDNDEEIKIAKTIHFNRAFIKYLETNIPRRKQSAFVDKVMSEFCGISYEEAYPRACKKSYGEERKWDIEGVYRKKDINDPTRNSKKNRKSNAPLAWRSHG
jgi:hypothetical protein